MKNIFKVIYKSLENNGYPSSHEETPILDMCKKNLKKHLNDEISIYAPVIKPKDIQFISEEKLRKGEISAEIYAVGAYVIRDSLMLYRDDDEVDYKKKIPADKEQVELFNNKNVESPIMCDITLHDYRVVHEIHSAYKYSKTPKWKFICSATSAKS